MCVTKQTTDVNAVKFYLSEPTSTGFPKPAMHDGREKSDVGEAKSMTGMGCPGITSSFVSQRGHAMKTMQRFAISAVAAAMMLGLGACSGMSAQGKSTAIGAGVGAVGGAVLTGGSAAGTVGGAAVGGIIGHEVNK